MMMLYRSGREPFTFAAMAHEDAERRRAAFRAFMEARDLRAAPWAARARVNPNAIYNFLRGRSGSLNQKTLESLAGAVGARVSDLIGETPVPTSAKVARIVVRGDVQAGAWREAMELEPDDQWAIEIPIEPRSARKAYGLVLRGPSMNAVYPDGTIVIVIGIHDFDDPIRNGDHVIVHRHSANGLVEATCKELVVDGERAWLWPRSTHPEYQAPLPVPWPYDDDQPTASGVESVEIVAVVIGSYTPRRRG